MLLREKVQMILLFLTLSSNFMKETLHLMWQMNSSSISHLEHKDAGFVSEALFMASVRT